MFRSIFTLVLLISTTNIVMANCSNNILGAKYKITTGVTSSKQKKTSQFVLWRNGNQVAHEHIDTHITEVWEHLKNGQLRLVKNFDDYNRGIEYEPNEIKMQHNNAGWQLKRQLITQSLIDDMKLESTTKKGCEILQLFTRKNINDSLNLEWLPKQKLIRKLTITTKKEKVTWVLMEIINDTKQVQKLFTKKAGYHMTDYSDIGDNESDPFLLKMINLGFVSHGVSGMYNQYGSPIEGGHQH